MDERIEFIRRIFTLETGIFEEGLHKDNRWVLEWVISLTLFYSLMMGIVGLLSGQSPTDGLIHVFVAFIATLIAICFVTVIIRILTRCVRGEGSLRDTFILTSIAFIPVFLLSWIPFDLIRTIASFLSLALLWRGIKEVYHFSSMKAGIVLIILMVFLLAGVFVSFFFLTGEVF